MIQIEIHEDHDGLMRWILRRDGSIVDERVTDTRSEVTAIHRAAAHLAAVGRADDRGEPRVGLCGHTYAECPFDCGYNNSGGWER